MRTKITVVAKAWKRKDDAADLYENAADAAGTPVLVPAGEVESVGGKYPVACAASEAVADAETDADGSDVELPPEGLEPPAGLVPPPGELGRVSGAPEFGVGGIPTNWTSCHRAFPAFPGSSDAIAACTTKAFIFNSFAFEVQTKVTFLDKGTLSGSA